MSAPSLMRPPAILSPTDHTDASWIEQPPGREPIPAPVDDREALVRWDLADTARKHVGMRSFVRAIEMARIAEDWLEISDDFDTARKRTGDSQARGVLSAAAEAAEAMEDAPAEWAIEAALSHLANPCGLTGDEWLTQTRIDRAKAGA